MSDSKNSVRPPRPTCAPNFPVKEVNPLDQVVLALPSELAARALGISEHTLKLWRSRGLGPKLVRLGNRKILYSIDALREWLTEQSVVASFYVASQRDDKRSRNISGRPRDAKGRLLPGFVRDADGQWTLKGSALLADNPRTAA